MKKILLAAVVLSIAAACATGGKQDSPAPAADYFQRGIAAMNAGDFDQAIEAFNEAVSRNVNTTQAHIGRAYSFVFKEEWSDATDSLADAIMSLPGVIDAFNRSDSYDFGDDFNRALADFEAALSIELTDDFKDEIVVSGHYAAQRISTGLILNSME